MELQGRYRILRKLGDGGMGSVYEGQHLKIGRRVAIKILHPQFADKPEIVARFSREAQAATSIGHPNIIEVTDMGELPDGAAYMVLEFLDGRDWSDDISKQGPQPIAKVAHILIQVCDALEAAHAKGIVHRDLKPENIFLIERRGDPAFVKVLDFGISKFADSQDRSLTQTGTALGTPYYMAPEQCQGKKDTDWRADIYALGVILFQALTNQYPFDDESYPMLVLKICTEAPPPLQAYRPDAPPELVQLTNRMLSKLRENRVQSCAEVRAALTPFLQHAGAPVLATNMPSTAARAPQVLDRASTPGGSHPGAMTPGSNPGFGSSPTGTAYLPSTPGAPMAESSPSLPPNRAPIFIVLALFVGLVMAGGALGVAFAFWPSGDPVGAEVTDVEPTRPVEDEVPAAANPAPAPEVAEATPAAVVAPTPTPPTAVMPVASAPRLSFTVTPPEATITIDGVQRENPFEGTLVPGMHHIVASADGYERHEQHREVTRDAEITVSLERSPRPSGRGRRRVVVQPPPPGGFGSGSSTGSRGMGQGSTGTTSSGTGLVGGTQVFGH
ncbi:MAG: serine/threonine protein kinase [Sandaracinaceae bacterium]